MRPWLSIPGKVGVHGRTLVDVARRRDVTRRHICQWRGETRGKGLWPTSDAPVFPPVEMTPALAAQAVTGPAEASAEITVVLCNGRRLRCADGMGDAAFARLVRLPETA